MNIFKFFFAELKEMENCRACQKPVDKNAFACPGCGAPFPAKPDWSGWGIEYKSKMKILGIPLVHISFKYHPSTRLPIPARGIISIGHVGIGVINISQFGVGIISISQITLALYAVAQFGIASSLIAQFGLYLNKGYGQFIYNIMDLI